MGVANCSVEWCWQSKNKNKHMKIDFIELESQQPPKKKH